MNIKKFILKSSLFVLPFLLCHIANLLFYDPNEGDLIRIGYIYGNSSPISSITSQYNLPKMYTSLSELDFNENKKFDLFVIGDSFSNQGSRCYKNFLANKNISVLHADPKLVDGRPIQFTVETLNSSFFDTVDVDYIVLQSVLREFNQRNENLNLDQKMDVNSLSIRLKNTSRESWFNEMLFFSDATVKAPLSFLQYKLFSKTKLYDTYRLRSIRDDLFSNNPKDLLFYKNDIENMNFKNDPARVANSVSTLNKIHSLAKKKGIKIIVLISPDKYDLYYPFIENKENQPEPLFFSFYDNMSKKYLNVDTYSLLTSMIQTTNDVYFYDDTHWSPKAAEKIAEEIFITINKENM